MEGCDIGSQATVTFGRQDVFVATLGDPIRERVAALEASRFLERLANRDPSLWADAPSPEIADRLGWFDLAEASASDLPRWSAFAREVAEEGTTDVLLLGMGGSSLAPEVFTRTFGREPGWPALKVLDSTHPHAVRAATERLDPRTTLFVVSSKSGTTVETTSLFRHAWSMATGVMSDAGRRFVAITDPGTSLARLAKERGFRAAFVAPPDVGGRFSALSVFGLLPAALAGVDVTALLDRAALGRKAVLSNAPGGTSALTLAAVLAECARAGRDKCTFVCSPGLAAFPAWLEQLIAESLGKDGKGIVPVAGESLTVPSAYRSDRLFVEIALAAEADPAREERLRELERTGHPCVRIRLGAKEGIAAEMYRWEIAVAAAASALGVQPFDQPDVQRAKTLADRAIKGAGPSDGKRTKGGKPVSAWDGGALRPAVDRFLSSLRQGDYVAILAFLAPSPETARGLEEIRAWVRDWTGIATTVGYGPRFLHSSGQMHKGGPASGAFLQILDEIADDLPIPETSHGFRGLMEAQAQGDAEALEERGRRLVRVDVGRDVPAGLTRVLAALRAR